MSPFPAAPTSRRFPPARAFARLCAPALFLATVLSAHAAFTNITASSGLDYLHSTTKSSVTESAAACAVDLDGDGWTDLIVARANQPCLAFINNRDGTFREESHARGLDTVSGIEGIAAGDFSNRGRPDIIMGPLNGPRYYYFVNDGAGHFTEQAVARGADVTTTLINHRVFTISLVDYDRDGYLDAYLCEDEVASTAEDAKHTVLLHNRGAAAPGYFENVTSTAGLTQSRAAGNLAFTGLWADFDEDGWPDLAIASDLHTSQLWWNKGNGTFLDGTIAAGVNKDEFGMGAAIADYDGDGKLDFFVTSIFDASLSAQSGTYTGNKLYRNLGSRHFAELAASTGVARNGWGWGAAFFDYENDSWPDLIVTNGTDFDATADPRVKILTGSANDPTTLYRNQRNGTFADITTSSGINDTGLGRAIVVMDIDNDGDEDLVVTNVAGHPVVYRNDASTNGNHWLRVRFQGSASNRDGYGTLVKASAGGRGQTLWYNPTNAFIGQRESVLHIGLGPATQVDSLEIHWPSGVVQTLTSVAANQVITAVETPPTLSAPSITVAPVGGTFAKDQPVTLRVTAVGNPAPVFVWYKNGVEIQGATGPSYRIARLLPFDAANYTVAAINPQGTVTSSPAIVSVSIDLSQHSVARWWNECLLDGIRKDIPNPPVHARNLYHLSAAMWDAFWAYQDEGWTNAAPVFHREDLTPADWAGDRAAAQRQAISYAAYRIITARFASSPGAAYTLFGARWLMQQYGFDPDFTGTDGNSPAAVGNRIGYSVLAACRFDGANEANRYVDQTGYKPLNEPLIVALPGTKMLDPNSWQPLALKLAITQNGIPLGSGVQSFVGSNALITTPFALAKPTVMSFSIDPGPPPRLGTATDADFKQAAVEVIKLSSQLDPTDGATLDISPGAMLNNPLGSNDGTGRPQNPFTGKPYAANVVKRGDYARVLAEFWADGPSSETPPGHWNVLLNHVTDDPRFVRRYAGQGDELPLLEWDVRAYLALNGAVHDAACLAWGMKHLYDSARPISMIRYMGGLGQSTDPAGPHYNASGLPLVSGLIEVVTAESSASGQRHAALAGSVGIIAIRAWQGNPADPTNQIGGVGWILAENWVPYQMNTFVTPAFPAYVSGHSTFSRAAAEVLTLLTGSPYFPGGLGEYAFKANQFLTFERGPTTDVTLQWATYYDAADQAGRSRLYGGIHISPDDFIGRRLGSQVGLNAFLHAQSLRGQNHPARGLVNLSSRARTGSGDDVVILGFVTEGDAAQPTLIRTIGPTLADYGVAASDCDDDPNLELHRSSDGSVLLTNNNWGTGADPAALAARCKAVGAFALPASSQDAAVLPSLDPGVYTVVSRSASPAKHGIQLAEIYGEHLVNLSTRGRVGTSSGILIGGFVLEGSEPTPVLLRAVGPGLTPYGVSQVLADPNLTLYHQRADGSWEVVGSNDDWSDDERASLIADAAKKTGAFPLTSGSKDAAIFTQLPAGIYTAQVSGVADTQGVALLELYHVK